MLFIGVVAAGLILLVWFYYHYLKKRRSVISNRWLSKKDQVSAWLNFWVSVKNWLQEDSMLFTKFMGRFSSSNNREENSSLEEISPLSGNIFDSSKTKRSKYVVIKLIAQSERSYGGYELYQAILSSELKLCAGGAFAKFDGLGNELFKLVPATTTGIFKNNAWGSFKCRGLILYMPYPRDQKGMLLLRDMWETARVLIDLLGGEIVDDQDRPFNLANFHY